MKTYVVLVIGILFLSIACKEEKRPPSKIVNAIINTEIEYQSIDGFGVNINPALWNDGKLKPALDMLVDELGATQFRFDCYGRANWLDSAKQLPDGSWPANYLSEVYRSRDFTDAWETFRYLNSKGIMPYFNVSGIVPQEWNRSGTKVLENFDAYAEMSITMLDWARNEEKLQFSLFAPFNETDFDGTREGPSILSEDRSMAVKAVVDALVRHDLNDIKLAVFCDGNFENARLEPFLGDSSFTKNVNIISGHTYANGGEGDGEPWYREPSRLGIAKALIDGSAYKGVRIWLNEYGDLDQTNDIENEFSWRITRRVLKAVKDGANSCQFWDAYDNLHKHDTAWTTYGLLATDTINHLFEPRKRFWASKQVYKYVLPGFIRIGIEAPPSGYNVYKEWQNPLKNINMVAFKSPDGTRLSIVGMSLIETPTELEFQINGQPVTGKMKLLVTNSENDCTLLGTFNIMHNKVKIPLNARTIFTLTNVEE